MPFPAVVDLNDIAAGDGGFKIQGEEEDDIAGWSISAAGDVNGDELDDLIVGAPYADDCVGAAHIVFGVEGEVLPPLPPSPFAFPAVVHLTDISLGHGGFKIERESGNNVAQDYSVSAAGDINGDGIDDVILGAPFNGSGRDYSGAAYVVFGRVSGFTSPLSLASIATGSGGFKIQGERENDRAGYSVSAAGDVNGDGIGDLIIGAHLARGAERVAGAAYVVFGRTDDFDTLVDLDDIAAGTGGFKILGEERGDRAGVDVSSAGDVNADGIDDLVLAASPRFTSAAYVVFGSAEDVANPIDLADIAAGRGGFKIQSETVLGGSFGLTVSAAGDINNDGIDDLILGDENAGRPDNDYLQGAAYVVFGRAAGFGSPVDLDAIAAGTGGFKILGENEFDLAGRSVSAAGDVDGDGIDDLIVGSPRNDRGGNDAGAAYVVFGRGDGFPAAIDLTSIAAGVGGFKIHGENPGDFAGTSVSAAGDVNGDGFDDVIVGAPQPLYATDAFTGAAGAAYVVFGQPDGLVGPVDLDEIAAGIGGFKIEGENRAGYTGFSVSAAGDLNGDGIDDLAVGSETGAAYVIFGRLDNRVVFADGDGDAVLRGGGNHDTLYGNGGNDRLFGLSGNDSLGGGEGQDSLIGDKDNDRLFGGNDADRLYGGAGNDAMLAGRDHDRMNGGSGGDRLFGQTGDDLISGAAGDDTVYGGAGNDKLHGSNGDDTLTGGAGIDVLAGGAGADAFVYTSLADRGDRIVGFEPGPDGDAIDLSRLLRGFTANADAAGFVNLGEQNSHTYIQVDPDGGGDRFVDLVILEFVTGLSLEQLAADGNLVLG